MKRSRSPSLSMSRNAAPVSQPLGPLALADSVTSSKCPLPSLRNRWPPPIGRDVEIGVAVVVVVADGHALAVERLVEPGLLGDVLEVSLAVVAIEGLGRRRLDLVAGPVRRVDEEQVLVAVAVVVEEGDARAHRLGQELLAEGAVVVDECDAGLLGDVDELDGRAGPRP